MKAKECKIICDGKEIATIERKDKGFEVKCSDEGMKMCKGFKGCC